MKKNKFFITDCFEVICKVDCSCIFHELHMWPVFVYIPKKNDYTYIWFVVWICSSSDASDSSQNAYILGQYGAVQSQPRQL